MKPIDRRRAIAVFAGGLSATGIASLPTLRTIAHATPGEALPILAASERTTLGGGVQPFNRWTYRTPQTGSLIRGQVGQVLRPTLFNQLDVPTTLHWHGLRVSKGMDGVSGKFDSPLVQPGESFDYEVPLRDPGTHWFHSHHDSLNQIARGLYGPLIVEDPDEPSLVEEVLVLDDWTVSGAHKDRYEIDWTKLEAGLAWGHAGVQGRVLTINGSVRPKLNLAFEGATRLRMLNAATGRVFRPSFDHASAWVIALDGYSVAPFELSHPIFLGPGQRMDVLIEPDFTGRTRLNLGESLFGKGTSFDFEIGLEASLVLSKALPAFKPYNPVELTPDAAAHQAVTLVMSEPYRDNEMGAGKVEGQWQDWETLVGTHRYWLLNDVADNSLGPLFSGRVGETVEVSLLNNSATHHVMHFHGQHVRVVTSTSAPHEIGTFRDSLTFEAWSKATIAMKLDRRGLWPLHCHILGHQISGMFTYYEVT